MPSTVSIEPAPSPLEQLIANSLRHLEDLGYSLGTRQNYLAVWRAFLAFARAGTSSPRLTHRLATAFLKSRGVSRRRRLQALTPRQAKVLRAMRVLQELQTDGEFRRHPKHKPDIALPAAWLRELDRYEVFCRRHLHHQEATIVARRWALSGFLAWLGSRGIDTADTLDAESLSAFIQTRGQRVGRRSLATAVGDLRSFVRFLSMQGLVAASLLDHLRGFRIVKEHRLPPVWPRQTVEALLGAVDRSSPLGKRDYAILLLACRLGLRATDIRSLRLDDILWSEARIRLVQSKTGRLPSPLPKSSPHLLTQSSPASILLAQGRPA